MNINYLLFILIHAEYLLFELSYYGDTIVLTIPMSYDFNSMGI